LSIVKKWGGERVRTGGGIKNGSGPFCDSAEQFHRKQRMTRRERAEVRKGERTPKQIEDAVPKRRRGKEF